MWDSRGCPHISLSCFFCKAGEGKSVLTGKGPAWRLTGMVPRVVQVLECAPGEIISATIFAEQAIKTS